MRPPAVPSPLAPAAASTVAPAAAPHAPPPPPSPRLTKRQRREAQTAAAALTAAPSAPAPAPNPRNPNPSPNPRNPNPRNPAPAPNPNSAPRYEPLSPGQLADQGTVTGGVCTLTFAPPGSTGPPRVSSWRVNECAASLGVDPATICWPKVIVSAQARDPSAQADHAMARCKHIGQPGHEHDGSAAHVVPTGLTSQVLARFRNP